MIIFIPQCDITQDKVYTTLTQVHVSHKAFNQSCKCNHNSYEHISVHLYQ